MNKYQPPLQAVKNARKAKEWRRKYPSARRAGTPVGIARMNQLARGEKVSADVVNRMAAFKRHQTNAQVPERLRNTPWKDRGRVAWLMWGGSAGISWATKKAKQIRKKRKV